MITIKFSIAENKNNWNECFYEKKENWMEMLTVN